MQRAAGLQFPARQLQQFRHLAGRLHLPGTPRHEVAAGQYAAGAIHSCCEHVPILQQVVHQTTHSLARFFLEIDANYKQFKTASRLRAAAALRLDRPAGLLRGRPDHDRPIPRRRQPVRHRRGDRGPVQDDLQHLDRRPGRSQGNTARLRQHRRRRRPPSAARPTSRPATSRMPIASSASHPTVRRFPSGRSARSIPIPPTTTRRRASIPPKAHSRCPAPSGPSGHARRRCLPTPPCRITRPCRRQRRRAGSAQPAASAGTAASADVQLTGGAPGSAGAPELSVAHRPDGPRHGSVVRRRIARPATHQPASPSGTAQAPQPNPPAAPPAAAPSEQSAPPGNAPAAAPARR